MKPRTIQFGYQPATRSAATTLSYLAPASVPGFSPVTRLACKSLFIVGMALTLSGCIVADPPEYESPGRTPPFLDLNASSPALDQVLLYNTGDPPIQFRIKVRSEDEGEDILGALYLDSTENSSLSRRTIPPSTISDLDRWLVVPFAKGANETIRPGCHVLTLLVMHLDTFDIETSRPKPAEGTSDIATASWWLNVDAPSSAPYDLINCPNPAEVEQ